MAPLVIIPIGATPAERARAVIEADLQRREQLRAEVERTAQAATALAAAAIAHQRAAHSMLPRKVVWL